MDRSLTAAGAYPRGLATTQPVEAAGSTEEELREQAIARLKKKRDFRTHIFIYCLVNAFLVGIWAVTSDADGFFWPIFPILGWGIGVGANAWDVYGRKPISEDEIRREAERLRGPGA
jgi:2TM domain